MAHFGHLGHRSRSVTQSPSHVSLVSVVDVSVRADLDRSRLYFLTIILNGHSPGSGGPLSTSGGMK